MDFFSSLTTNEKLVLKMDKGRAETGGFVTMEIQSSLMETADFSFTHTVVTALLSFHLKFFRVW